MGEIELLKENIGDIVDPRRTECGNLCHALETIIVIGLCTVIVGGESYEDMEEFGNIRADMLFDFDGFFLAGAAAVCYLISVMWVDALPLPH